MDETVELEATGDPRLDDLFARLSADIHELNTADLTALVRLESPSTGLHAAARNLELLRRRLAVFDSAYVTAVEIGGEPARYARPSTAVFLAEQLRLSRAEARRRVELAHAITPGLAFTGEVLPAPLPALAAAVAAGEVSGEHARTVIETIARLPVPMRQDHGAVVEAEMVQAARKVTPAELDTLVPDIMLRADPDGVLRDAAHAHGQRDLRLTKHRGRAGGRLIAELDDEGYELAKTVLDARSKPVPAAPAAPVAGDANPASADGASSAGAAATRLTGQAGLTGQGGQGGEPGWAEGGAGQPAGEPAGELAGRDARPLGKRMYDGLVDVLTTVLNSGDLPACGGTPAGIVWHIDDQALRDRYGLAVSEHGTLIPIGDALRMADQSNLYLLVETSKRVPLYLGRAARIASPGQTIALAARDRGCSFPGCDRPPSHCQRHHITDWLHEGQTDIDNLTLLCGFHHREFAKRGWDCLMLGGLPHWRPPAWLDPQRQPIRNTRHFTLPNTDVGRSGVGRFDAGEFDAGEFDTGEFDTGEFDAGEFDAGEFDAGRSDTG